MFMRNPEFLKEKGQGKLSEFEILLESVIETEVVDENGNEVSPLDDDYEYWKNVCEDRSNPLSDDYCKYDND